MSTFSKTQGVSLLALQTIVSGAVALGTPVDVSTKISASVFIHVGRTIATALTNGHKVRVEVSAKATLDGFWFSMAEFVTGVTVSTTTATLTTGTTAGTATLPMTTTAGIVVGDKIYIREAGAETNSEFGRVITVNANTSVVIEDGTLYNHTITTSKIWSQAEFFMCQLDLSGIGRVRVVADSGYANVGQTVVTEAFMVTADGFA